MALDDGAAAATPPGNGAAHAPRPDTLLHTLQALWRDLPGLVSDRVHLLALELQRAGIALATMVVLVIGAAVLGATAWVALWIGIAAALLQTGLAWGWVFLIVLLLNVGGAVFALLRAKSLAHLLTLPATVRRLTVAPVPPPATSHPVYEHVNERGERIVTH